LTRSKPTTTTLVCKLNLTDKDGLKRKPGSIFKLKKLQVYNEKQAKDSKLIIERLAEN
jgi:hypothetical protein